MVEQCALLQIGSDVIWAGMKFICAAVKYTKGGWGKPSRNLKAISFRCRTKSLCALLQIGSDEIWADMEFECAAAKHTKEGWGKPS